MGDSMSSILKKVRVGDWDKYKKLYRKDKLHWYLIPKAKDIDDLQLINIQGFLTCLNKWFVEDDLLNKKEKKFKEHFFSTKQEQLPINGMLTDVTHNTWSKETPRRW